MRRPQPLPVTRKDAKPKARPRSVRLRLLTATFRAARTKQMTATTSRMLEGPQVLIWALSRCEEPISGEEHSGGSGDDVPRPVAPHVRRAVPNPRAGCG